MRSYLFAPGDSPDKMAKAIGCGTDVAVLDLEDSVAPDNKAAARKAAASVLKDVPRGGAQVYVRVNSFDTDLMEADLAAIADGRPDGIMLPKSQSVADVIRLNGLLHELQVAAPEPGGLVKIIAIATETAASLFQLGSYAGGGERLDALCWGAEDLSADLGAQSNVDEHGRYTGPYELARTLCLVGARAAGLEPIDGIYGNFRDQDGLWDSCRRALRDGFSGKLAIHPAQVPIINRAFTPSAGDVERARRIVEAFAAAGNPGVIGLDGEMLDKPHLERARKLLTLADRYARAPLQ